MDLTILLIKKIIKLEKFLLKFKINRKKYIIIKIL
jgi:hypothetical protein